MNKQTKNDSYFNSTCYLLRKKVFLVNGKDGRSIGFLRAKSKVGAKLMLDALKQDKTYDGCKLYDPSNTKRGTYNKKYPCRLYSINKKEQREKVNEE